MSENNNNSNRRDIKEKVLSKNKSTQLSGLSELRNLVSQSDQSVIDESLILHLLQFLDKAVDLELQVESSAILSELLLSKKSEYCRALNESKELEQLINALDLDNQVVLENVLSALNSLLQEDPKTRKIYFTKGCMKKIPKIMEKYPIPPIKKNVVFLLFNITKDKPYPKWGEIKSAVSVLQEAIKGMQSGETLAHALSSVAAITDGDIINEIINLGLVPFLVQHVYNQDQEIFFPALRALGNIITGDDEQTEKVLALPDFPVRLFELIYHADKSIQKEVCWILSNIAAGSESQKNIIVQGPDYMNALKHALNQGDEKVAIEVSWVYSNLAETASEQFINKLVEQHEFIQCLSIMLSKNNRKIDELGLGAVQTLLKIDHPKIRAFVEDELADKVSQISSTKRKQKKIEQIQYQLEEMGFENIQLKLAPSKARQQDDNDGAEEDEDDYDEGENEDEYEYDNEQTEHQNED